MILLGLALMVCWIPGVTGFTIPSGWVLLSAVLPWFLWRRTTFPLLHRLGGLFMAYAIASMLWTVRRDDAIFELWQLAIAAMSFHLGSTLESPRALWTGLAIGILPSSILSIFQMAGYWDPIAHSGIDHATGLFYNSVVLGETAAIITVACASEGLWWALPLAAPAIALSQSRGAVIGLGVPLLLWMGRSAATWMGIALIALLLCVFLFSPTDDLRLQVWRVAWDNLSWFGMGAGSFESIYIFTPNLIYHAEWAHNEPLDLMFQFGLGCVPLALALALALRRSDAHEWYPLVSFCAMALFSWPLHSPVLAFVGACSAGRIARLVHVDGASCVRWGLRLNLWHPREKPIPGSTRRESLPVFVGP